MQSASEVRRGSALMAITKIERRIRDLRGQKVLLDSDLAVLYEVPVKALNQAVKRNAARFPADFMFPLTPEEFSPLKSQLVTSSWGGRRRPPYAFTEQGVAMLSSVLRSRRAVGVNIEIMRAFVRLRQVSFDHKQLSRRLDLLEATSEGQFRAVFKAIRELMPPADKKKTRAIGFMKGG
jgi:ORF6N domain